MLALTDVFHFFVNKLATRGAGRFASLEIPFCTLYRRFFWHGCPLLYKRMLALNAGMVVEMNDAPLESLSKG
jgi:hypothetical protein